MSFFGKRKQGKVAIPFSDQNPAQIGVTTETHVHSDPLSVYPAPGPVTAAGSLRHLGLSAGGWPAGLGTPAFAGRQRLTQPFEAPWNDVAPSGHPVPGSSTGPGTIAGGAGPSAAHPPPNHNSVINTSPVPSQTAQIPRYSSTYLNRDVPPLTQKEEEEEEGVHQAPQAPLPPAQVPPAGARGPRPLGPRARFPSGTSGLFQPPGPPPAQEEP